MFWTYRMNLVARVSS